MENKPTLPPDWTPRPMDGSRILVVGASGGIGRTVVDMLSQAANCVVGAHRATAPPPKTMPHVHDLQRRFKTESDCTSLVDEFVELSGGIDGLVLLNGGLNQKGHWLDTDEATWNADLETNLSHPFFIARHAMKQMRTQNSGGRIVFNGTESALHGGSAHSMPYAMTKLATECRSRVWREKVLRTGYWSMAFGWDLSQADFTNAGLAETKNSCPRGRLWFL